MNTNKSIEKKIRQIIELRIIEILKYQSAIYSKFVDD